MHTQGRQHFNGLWNQNVCNSPTSPVDLLEGACDTDGGKTRVFRVLPVCGPSVAQAPCIKASADLDAMGKGRLRSSTQMVPSEKCQSKYLGARSPLPAKPMPTSMNLEKTRFLPQGALRNH